MNDNRGNHFRDETGEIPKKEMEEPLLPPEIMTRTQEAEEATPTKNQSEEPLEPQQSSPPPEADKTAPTQGEATAQAESAQSAPPQNPYQPYGQNQNPYQANGQYGQQNTYGQDQNPYQANGQYGQQNTYGQNQNPYQANGQYGQQNTYGQNQNPYQANGQYGQQNTAGQNQNPYQAYGQYGQQNPYGQNQNPYQAYGQYGQQNTAGQNQNPYQPMGNSSRPPHPPQKMSKGLKIFLWIFGITTVLCVVGFLVVGIVETYHSVRNQGSWSQNEALSSQQSEAESQAPTQQSSKIDPDNAGIQLQPMPAGEKLDPHTIYNNVVESVVGIKTTIQDTQEETQGSGIIATQDGYIITNSHVMGNSRENKVIVILHGDEKEYPAAVVGYDNTTDLSILKIEKSGLHPATFGNSDQLQVGDWVLAIGNPGGVNFASTLTGGYVSAINRTLQTSTSNEMTYIQTDAAINPGNSGGPLVNMHGQVVGINSNKIIASGYEGMGFSIPTSRAKTVLDELITRGYVGGRAKLGITVKDMTHKKAQMSGMPQGVIVLNISSGSDFQNKGIISGDIITKVDGQAITATSHLFDLLGKHKPGDVIKVTIYSPSAKGAIKDVSIKLIEIKE